MAHTKEALKLKLILLLVVLPLVVFVGYKVATKFFIAPTESIAIDENSPQAKKRNYVFNITKGDTFIDNKEWESAIVHYSKAVTLFPEIYDANYRLGLSYTYACNNAGTHCTEAKTQLKLLLKKFPDNPEVIQLSKRLQKK